MRKEANNDSIFTVKLRENRKKNPIKTESQYRNTNVHDILFPVSIVAENSKSLFKSEF